MEKRKAIGILGAGAFGTALALVYRGKFNVTLFSSYVDHVISMRQTRSNEFLNGFTIPNDVQIEVTSNLEKNRYDYLFWVFPTKPTVTILENLKARMDLTNVIVCSKGLLSNSSFVCDLFKEKLPSSEIGYLAGANFSVELAEGKISTADVASRNLRHAKMLAEELTTENFVLNPIDDMVGAQISGAIKNIVAIACGIAYGLNLGENAHASLITMALSEMRELGMALGAKKETFCGFCGLADLILTTSSPKSRNMSLGFELSQGKSIDEILKNSTCEGYDTLPQIIDLAGKNNVKIPICNAVYKIVFENQAPNTINDVFK